MLRASRLLGPIGVRRVGGELPLTDDTERAFPSSVLLGTCAGGALCLLASVTPRPKSGHATLAGRAEPQGWVPVHLHQGAVDPLAVARYGGGEELRLRRGGGSTTTLGLGHARSLS